MTRYLLFSHDGFGLGHVRIALETHAWDQRAQDLVESLDRARHVELAR